MDISPVFRSDNTTDEKFFDNDEKLFIIGECPEERIKIIIWDLFDTGKHELIELDDFPITKQIVIDGEPWVPGGYERNSYCLYYNEKGTETETLQLIVGRSTVQIWHQINDDSKNKDELPNKGEAFLEYIWSNRIPVKLEGEKTRLIIEEFEYKYGTNDGSNSLLV
uniref:Uncharacterized protein n=1 Tax=Rhizophagus irregularis (strain DAOM 181602 / DAOM 197198 / MUCL 43194) TaxID=747089 RepID=U9SSU6_RHIID